MSGVVSMCEDTPYPVSQCLSCFTLFRSPEAKALGQALYTICPPLAKIYPAAASQLMLWAPASMIYSSGKEFKGSVIPCVIKNQKCSGESRTQRAEYANHHGWDGEEGACHGSFQLGVLWQCFSHCTEFHGMVFTGVKSLFTSSFILLWRLACDMDFILYKYITFCCLLLIDMLT